MTPLFTHMAFNVANGWVRMHAARALLLGAVVIISGCNREEAYAHHPPGTQRLNIDNQAEPHDLDPHTETGALERAIISGLFEGLLTRDGREARLVPAIAQRWEISQDGRAYTFHLRPEARWSNGQAITATDFVLTFKRLLSPELGCEYRVRYYPVVGAKDFAERRLDDFEGVGIKALNPQTLQITLSEPCAFFLDLLAEGEAVVLPVEHIARWGGLTRRGTAWTKPGNLLGSGAFTLKEWTPQVRVVIEKSDTYWNAASVRLHQVAFHPTEAIDVAERMFRAGQLHISRIPPAKIEAYRRDRPGMLWSSAMPRTSYIVANVKRPALADARVRRALALAIDRDALVSVLRNGSVAARACPPPNLDGYHAADSFQESLAEARQLLIDAGFAGGKGLGPLNLLFAERHNPAGILEALQEMWRVNLGLDVKLRREEWKVFLDSEKNGQYDLAADGWSAYFPCAYYELFTTSGSELSWYFWRNEAYDTLYTEAARTMDQSKRHAVYSRMDAILAAEMPIIPLYHHAALMLLQPNVRGYDKNWAHHHPLDALWLESGK